LSELVTYYLSSRGVAVKGKEVLGAGVKASELARVGGAGNVGVELGGGLFTEESKEVSTEASNVGGGYGSARDGVLFYC